MVRRIQHPNSDTDGGKIRFVYAEVEGSNQTLQNLLTTMVAAMSRGPVSATSRQIAAATKPPADKETPKEPTLFSEVAPEGHAADTVSQLDEAVNGNGTTKRARGEGPKTDRNAGLTPVPELNLIPQGKQSLQDFVAAKKPTTAVQEVLVFVYYLAHTLSVAPITANHVLSCFKHIGTKVPVDLPQTIRNVLAKAWLTGDLTNLRISTEGENQVEHRIGKKAGKGSN
jgi:hypothetical protein